MAFCLISNWLHLLKHKWELKSGKGFTLKIKIFYKIFKPWQWEFEKANARKLGRMEEWKKFYFPYGEFSCEWKVWCVKVFSINNERGRTSSENWKQIYIYYYCMRKGLWFVLKCRKFSFFPHSPFSHCSVAINRNWIVSRFTRMHALMQRHK